MGAPICNINTKNPPPQSKAPALTSIPVATDLQSLIAAVNALRQLTIQYFNQITPSNPLNPVNPANPQAPQSPSFPGFPGVGDFSEDVPARTTVTTRIYDPNDPTNETYIDVQQITGLKFANRTGQTINWSQGS